MKKLLKKTTMCISRRLLHITLLCFMLLGFSGVAWGATIYLNPTKKLNSNYDDTWASDNAWFLAHFWSDGGSSTSVKMNSVGDGYYSCEVPSGKTKVMFFRKDPAFTEHNTDNGNWNKTGDLTIPTDGKNLFTPNSWDNCTGDWSVYSSGSEEEEDDLPDALPDAVVCGQKTTLFFEDFGTLDGEKKRKKNNQINEQDFYTSYNYVDECAKIKNAGEYAIVATPRWSGCSSINDADYSNTCSCGNSDTGKWWYNENYDHTDDDGNGTSDDDDENGIYGGMLQFDCRNGSATDVLYQRTVSGVCSNTLVNFSAWVTKANVSDADPIKARFILRKGGASGEVIGRKDIADIAINQGWINISAMFNSGTLSTNGEITIQLINLAPYGQNGNDILLDDLELSVCTPKATLKTSNGKDKNTIITGQGEKLSVEVLNGIINDPYYFWQRFDTRTKVWGPVDGAETLTSSSECVLKSMPVDTKYRVIIAPYQPNVDMGAVLNEILNNLADKKLCGMYAISNEVTVNVKPMTVEVTPASPNICVGDDVEYTIKVTNPLTNVVSDNFQFTFEAPTQARKDYVLSSGGQYNNGVCTWNLTQLPIGTTSFSYKAISTETGTSTAYAYVSKVGENTYDGSVSPYTKVSSTVNINEITFITSPTPNVEVCEGSSVTLTAEAKSVGCTGEIKYQWVRRPIGATTAFTAIDGATQSTYIISAVTKADTQYEYAVWANIDGCSCVNVQSSVATITFVPKTTVPTAVKDYYECQETGKQQLKELVTVDLPDNLVFYTTQTGNETVTEFDKNIPISTKYFFTYQETDKCASDRGELSVIVLATPVAKITSDEIQRVCAEESHTFTVTATAQNGVGKWKVGSVIGGTASVANATNITAQVTVSAGATANITWTVVAPDARCEATASTTLIVDKKPEAEIENGKGSQEACAKDHFTVAVKPHAGTGRWSFVGNSYQARILTPEAFETKVENIQLGEKVTLRYTASNGDCDKVVSADVTLENLICNNLVLENGVNDGEVCKNDEVIFTISITNHSTVTSTAVKAEAKLPSGLQYLQTISATGTYVPQIGVWTVGDLAVNGVATLEIKVKALATSTLTAKVVEASSETMNLEEDAKVTVNELPTAKFNAAASEICGSLNESSAIGVTLTGKAPYSLTYTIDGAEKTETGIYSPHSIAQLLGEQKDYQFALTKVEDSNGCKADITGENHTVTVDKDAELGNINKVSAICENTSLTLPSVPTITYNGSTVSAGKWLLNGVELTSNVLNANDNGKKLKYMVESTCGTQAPKPIYSNEVLVTVDANPSNAVIALDKIQQCNDPVFNVTANPITVGKGEWSIVSGDVTKISPIDNNVTKVTLADDFIDQPAKVKWTVKNGVCNSKSDEIELINNNCTAIEITAYDEGPKVCYGSLATFEFTLQNSSVVDVKDVTLELTLGDGLVLQEATVAGYAFVAGKCVIPNMSAGLRTRVEVKAKATVDNAAVTIKVIKSSNKDVVGVEASHNVTVYALPTAQFEASSSVICASESEDTAIKVNFTGTPNYKLTYTVDGVTKVADQVANPYTIEEALTSVGTYDIKLVSVTDKNDCVGTIKDQEHTTKVEKYAALSNISDVDPICEESAVDLPTEPTVYENGSKVSDRKWMLDGTVIDANTTIPYTKEEQELWYQVGSTCATYTKTILSNKVTLKVDRKPTIANAGPDQTQCNNGEFVMAANTPQFGTGKWSVVGSSVLNYEEDNATTTVTGVPETESVELIWTISSKLDACRASTDNVILTNNNCTNFELKAVGDPSEVCPNGEAEFNFTLKNTATVDVEDVKLNLTFETGLTLVSAKVESLPFETDNTITIKELKAGASVSIQVKATADATANGKNVSIILVESFGVPVGLTVSQKVVVNQNPVVTNIKSYTGEDPTKPKVEESKVITCTNPVLYLHPTIESENEVSYTWTPNATSKINPVRAEGTYTLKVVDNVTGCESEEKPIDITENKVYPVLEDIISTTKVIVEGESYEEVNVLDCNNQSLILNPVIKDQSGMLFTRDLEFVWSKVDENGNVIAQGGTGKTETVTTEGFYTLQIIDAETGCPGELKTIEIKKETSKPVINNIISYTRESANDPERVESKVLTCTNPILYLNPEIESVNEVSYLWSTGSTEKVLKVEYEGTYTLVATDTKTGCSTDAVKCEITENKRTPIIDDIISVNSTDETVEGYKETQIINCKDTELFIKSVVVDNVQVGYTPEELEYNWTISNDNGENYKEYGTAETISTKSEAIFKLVVTDKETGCPAEAKTIKITENLVKPVITYIESYETIDPSGTGIKDEDILTCYKPVVYLKPTIDKSTDVSYKWGDGTTNDYLKVEEAGTYTLVVIDNTTFCSSEESTFTVTENKRTPIIDDIISVNSTDETVEGYKETQIINCKDTELFISSVIKDKVDKQYSTEELKYDWTVSYDDGVTYTKYGEAETISTTKEAIFRLVVTDKLTGCPAEAKTIEITEVKTTPTITAMTSVTTIDPDAEKVEETSVLTCEYSVLYLKPTITSENEVTYKWDDDSAEEYREVKEGGTYSLVVTDNTTFCSTTEYPYEIDENKNAPKLTLKAVYELCPSDVSVDMTLSSLLPNTEGIIYTFYDEAGDELEDLYAIPTESETTTYFVVGTSANGCPSEKAKFTVDFAQNVDFTLTASQTSMLVGGNETVIEVIPANGSDVNAIYQWTANDEDLIVDGLQYVDNLYLDTNFKVTGSNRCNSVTKEAFVEVLWPTAFTPHNNNGLNETFAKGMKLVVFNRFYTKIFEGPDGWDGTINGSMNESESIAVPGVYYYSVQLPNGQVKKGTIEIVKVD